MLDDATQRRNGMPEDEIDDDRTVGGGVLSEGGTAIDRGTGTLSGPARDLDDEDDDDADTGSSALDLSEPDFGADLADRALGHDD
jgi:hypothetical protein